MANHLCHKGFRGSQRLHFTEADVAKTMAVSKSRPAVGAALFYGVAFSLAVYFTFAAVQGDYGLFRRAEISAQTQLLQQELDVMQSEVARMENLTKRLSDDYLDLDLVDQQARSVLGMLRADEMVIR